MLIECSRCRTVFSLQDGVAPAGSRFPVQCGRCQAVFEAVAAPKSAPLAAQRAAPPAPAPAEEDQVVAPEDEEWSPEPAEAVVEPEESELEPVESEPEPEELEPEAAGSAPAATQSEPAAGERVSIGRADSPARRKASRGRWVAGAVALAVGVTAMVTLYERGRRSSVEEKMRQGRESLLRDDTRSLQEATKLFTDAARASPGQAVPEAARAFALLLQASAHKDLAARLAAAQREEQERAAAKLLQQGAAAARQALAEDPEEPAALRATALAEAISGKADQAEAHAEKADSASPGDPWTLYVKGVAAAAGLKRDRAVQALSAARQLEPKLIRVDVDLASISLDSGDPAGARALLEKVLQANSRHERARRMLSAIPR